MTTQQAVIYARFSPRPKGAMSKCASNETQILRCASYCSAHDYVILNTYQDEGISGATMFRENLHRALEVACHSKATLVVYSLSRLARNTADALEICERLEKAGASLAMLDTHIDTSTPVGRCFFTIMAAIATLEREQTAERTRDAMLSMQANGRRMSDSLPYGFEDDPETPPNGSGRPTGMKPDEQEQAVIERMVALRNEGLGYRAIGRKLTKEGHKCRGRSWHHGTISRILKTRPGFSYDRHCRSG
jgi:DNA invertase Pin-like site-specific DNA recombinase